MDYASRSLKGVHPLKLKVILLAHAYHGRAKVTIPLVRIFLATNVRHKTINSATFSHKCCFLEDWRGGEIHHPAGPLDEHECAACDAL